LRFGSAVLVPSSHPSAPLASPFPPAADDDDDDAAAASAWARAMIVSNVGPCPSSRSKLCSSRLCMLAMMRALIAATSCLGLFPLVASSCASICEAVRMCIASAEKSGWSTELFRGLWSVILLLPKDGLNDSDEPPELRG